MEVYGFDGGKKVKPRKRDIVVDSQRLLIRVLVSEANASQRLGAIAVLDKAEEKRSNLELMWVDPDSGKNFAYALKPVCGQKLPQEVRQRTLMTFEQLPLRWIVKRTFGWLN